MQMLSSLFFLLLFIHSNFVLGAMLATKVRFFRKIAKFLLFFYKKQSDSESRNTKKYNYFLFISPKTCNFVAVIKNYQYE